MEKQIGESWFEELLRCNDHFPEVGEAKRNLPIIDSEQTNKDVDMDGILKSNSAQYQLDELIRTTQEKTDAAALEKHTEQQNHDEKQSIVITPYMRTPGYQNLRNYWYMLPNLIPQIVMHGGESGGQLNFQGIGEPDENLLQQFELMVQKYLDYYFSELGLEAHIMKPVYQENGGIYRKIDDYRLSIRKHEKMK